MCGCGGGRAQAPVGRPRLRATFGRELMGEGWWRDGLAPCIEYDGLDVPAPADLRHLSQTVYFGRKLVNEFGHQCDIRQRDVRDLHSPDPLGRRFDEVETISC